MIKYLWRRTPFALLMGMVITAIFGAGLDLVRACEQVKRPESSATAVPTAAQGPGYAGPQSCLVEGVRQPAACRVRLPECLSEDGSGEGVWCFWTDPDTGDIWFNDGDESNDPRG